MVDKHNPLVKVFRMARNSFQSSECRDVHIRLISNQQRDRRKYNLLTVSKVAALIVGYGQQATCNRDVIV